MRLSSLSLRILSHHVARPLSCRCSCRQASSSQQSLASDDITAESVKLKPRLNYTPVIGLELHVQLACRTKLFSRSPVMREGNVAGPNRLVGPFDVALPGIMPRLNKRAVILALQMARLFQCEIPERSRFDRKHYFYADMPAGYQITQHDMPIAKNGRVNFYVYAEGVQPYEKSVRITQLQLEQDSGKTIRAGNELLIDHNRAGIALVEIVTEPDFSTGLEAKCFVEQLRLLLMHYGICEGELHRGHLRTDANVSLAENGQMGVRTEIKNLQNYNFVRTAINYELDRQYRILAAGGRIRNETRSIDNEGRTIPMRDKEEETDYRFMVEPNLPMLRVKEEWIAEVDAEIANSQPRFQELVKKFNFPVKEAIEFANDVRLSYFVSMCESRLPNVKILDFIDWLAKLKLILSKTKLVFPPQNQFFATQFVAILELVDRQKITTLTAYDLLRAYAHETEGREVQKVIQEDELSKLDDQKAIGKILDELLVKDPKLMEKCQSGSQRAIVKLARALVDECKKRIERQEADRIVEEKLMDLKKS